MLNGSFPRICFLSKSESFNFDKMLLNPLLGVFYLKETLHSTNLHTHTQSGRFSSSVDMFDERVLAIHERADCGDPR